MGMCRDGVGVWDGDRDIWGWGNGGLEDVSGDGPDVVNFCPLPQAAEKFESKLKESVLEADGQLAFRKLADVTAETLMPKIETKGEFGQARWRLTSAPQIPNLLSLDPTTDPFKSLANLSFGAEVEIQIGKKLQVRIFSSLLSESILALNAIHCFSVFSSHS